ncbi:MAG: response regulator [Proteobacteria bacterium]|nr:MAG: response regulator [Pseudomonadota bacterium]
MYTRIKTILVADSNPDYRRLIRSVLADVEILDADNALDAMNLLKTEKIDMIILDFRLPDKSGVEVLHWCRANEIHVPVIFMSQDSKLQKAEEVALADCCASLFHKPLNLKSLVEAVRAADLKDHHENCLHHYHGMITRDVHI